MSDFWLKKMRTYFQRIDFDKDGHITRNDFTAMADRFAGKAKTGADALRTRITSVYDNYLGKATGGKPVNQEEFVNTMKENIGKDDMMEKLKGPLPLLFAAVDTDQDGMISGPEFENFFEIIGIERSMADATFKAIDENNDGQLSLDEFVTAGLDFFANQDHSINEIFWGPLVE